MMPDFITKVAGLFNQRPDINKMGFLSSFFKTTADSFTDAEEFEYDLSATGEDSAPVVRDLSTDAVWLVEDKFANKKVPFPVYALARPASVAQLMKRMPGENAYAERVNWLGKLARILVEGFAKMTMMLRYSIELQASQVLQTGRITLTDEKGNAVYELDLSPKTSHFPTVGVDWGASGAKPLADISALADTIRNDGLCDISNLIFGKAAWNNFIADTEVKEAIKQDGLQLGALNPVLVGKGGKYMGYIHVGSYRFDLWVYNAAYNKFGLKEKIKFIDDNKVIFLPDVEELDFRKMFGGIPTVDPDAMFPELFQGKIQIDNEYDFRPRVWFEKKNEAYIAELKSRPLCWPFSIDRYGCLTVKQ